MAQKRRTPMSNGTPLEIGRFGKLAGAVIANLPREMDPQLALDYALNGDALAVVLKDALTRPNLEGALVGLGKKVEPKPILPILDFIDAVTLPVRTTKFVPKKSYIVNTKPGPHVKFGYIDPDFLRWF